MSAARQNGSGGRPGLRLGEVAGIEVFVDWSLLIVFGLIAFSLATGNFAAWHPDWGAGLTWATALAAAVLFFASVLVHELAHALVGRGRGIEIRRITLFMLGGMAEMQTQPPTWRSELVMALAGPATSLGLGLLAIWLAALVAGPVEIDPRAPLQALGRMGPVATLLLWLGPVNVLLGLFNLVPGFPLDGGRALRAVMWAATGDLRVATRLASRVGQAFAGGLVVLGLLMMLGLRVPVLGGGLLNGLWLAFIGWFLNNAALVSYRQMLVREALEDVPVARLMERQVARVQPGTSVATLVYEHVMASGQRAFSVERDGRFLGLVSLRDVHRCAREAWEATPVEAIMTPVGELATVPPQRDATEALAVLAERDVNQLPVLEGDRLVGLIRREDVVKWLSLHAGRGEGGWG